jgi:translation initiation factor 1
MKRKSEKQIPEAIPFGHNPFAHLSSEGLPPPPPPTEPIPEARVARSPKPPKNRGRVDIVREKAHRGGKIVTVIRGFVGIGHPEIESLAKAIQKSCGTGGTVKEGQIEIQGDRRDEAARILTEAGFRPVFAGG